ncbi:ribonuclease P protein component [uncultured Bacteroides sp.]|uniref:ribonuclease P protein component n=1 Tax=uncultured Bacteroides sp. TaxID=162156 RepID=UPI002AAC1EC1|nr:ribonuclease P protein component [uncultured Bacteroides sp.]
MNILNNGLCKDERLNSKSTIEELFSGNSKSFSIYPLRVVFMPVEKKKNALASILISVPKKRFKRAVKRNKVKRQVREGYRKNKHELLNVLNEKENGLAIAFIYLSNEILPTNLIEETIKKILEKIKEKIQ